MGGAFSSGDKAGIKIDPEVKWSRRARVSDFLLSAELHSNHSPKAKRPANRRGGTSDVGTFRKWRYVSLESVMRFKADLGEMNIAACSSK
jgi:hypothetical protein